MELPVWKTNSYLRGGKFKARWGVATETHFVRQITLTQTENMENHVLVSILELQNHTYQMGVMEKT